ncbi:TIP120-domain-containing protein [Fistulina hepatica ATCC 64428]|uniref:TIP120-domain-containing protein n=1 Tax=Fistulina hepatica ATCC 64428 TaxID=1128425 RepID=A0A0D7AB56_9AGAR|nr:TIP120-domain-containing protein [Fistulina hepatica ATCC 64428]
MRGADCLPQMQSQDQDFRFMGLNDLMNEIRKDPTCFVGDESVENRVLNQVLSLVEDKISEVKNQAVKCLAVLIKIIKAPQMEAVIEKLVGFSTKGDEELRDISSLALKTIVAELPTEGSTSARVAQTACEKLLPKLLTQLAPANDTLPPETLVETLTIVGILVQRFPASSVRAVNQPELKCPPPLSTIVPLLDHVRPVVRKRAIATLALLVPLYAGVVPVGEGSREISGLVEESMVPYLQPQRTTVQLITAIARQAPQSLTPNIPDIIPGILAALDRPDDELRESALMALEALVLRCPTEMSTFTSTSVVVAGCKWIKYDPNYTAEEDDDEEMASPSDEDDDDDQEDDDDLDDEYSDDEDTSYKIRRAAVKVLTAIITTRPDLLAQIFVTVAPVLVARFTEREAGVRLDVWTAYGALVAQTCVYGTAADGSAAFITSSSKNKRKRDDDDDAMEESDRPVTLLRTHVPALTKALLKDLRGKPSTPATLQAALKLLHSLIGVLPGCLTADAQRIILLSGAVLAQPPSSSTAELHLTCLAFLADFFKTHDVQVYAGLLPDLTPILLRSASERHPRVAAEAFRVFCALLVAMQPISSIEPSTAWVSPLYTLVVTRVTAHDTDTDVKARVEMCVGDLWACAADVVKGAYGIGKEWRAICKSTGKTDGAVRVIGRVAGQMKMLPPLNDEWVNFCIEWLLGLLRKSGSTSRTEKIEIFGALGLLLSSYSSGMIPEDVALELIPAVKTYLVPNDLSLLAQSLTIYAILLETTPPLFREIESQVLQDVYVIARSPLIPSTIVTTLDALLRFISALVASDREIATHLVPGLTFSVGSAGKGKSTATEKDINCANIAKCVAQVVKINPTVAAGTIAQYAKSFQASKVDRTTLVFSLLIMGELGRFIDMSKQQDIFNGAINYFESQQEEVRSAAAFAAGNMAIGNLHLFLPVIVKLVKSDAKKRLLALHSLKEVVTHCSHAQLENIADMLWVPLFENSENSEETTRNVAAACLGKLTVTHPSLYLPQLHDRIRDENSATRATVVAAIRYSFADTAQSYDELLASLLPDFLVLMNDSDLTVRRLTLSALNSAARTKPHLIRDHLSFLLPALYAETVIKEELIRTVQMGPWTHKVDDGLEARKTAYETMYTLLDTCLPKLDLHQFLTRVLVGLADTSDEIKVICHMMLFRLSQVAPTAVALRLDDATPHLEKTMKGATVTKDTVKQDLERAAELQRSALRAVVALSKISGAAGTSPKFDNLVKDLKHNAWALEFREMSLR